jgi:hypothetical protein
MNPSSRKTVQCPYPCPYYVEHGKNDADEEEAHGW